MSVPRRSVLAMAVLSMLREEPMHAYRMQQMIKERHKDEVVNVAQRNSVYQTIERLLRDGLIEIQSTGRSDNRPERTVYQLTGDGGRTLDEWMHAMLSTPAREFPEFPAALAFLPTISVAAAVDALTARVERLEAQLSALDSDIAQGLTFLPRLFLIESEYQREVVATELRYVRALVADLESAEIRW